MRPALEFVLLEARSGRAEFLQVVVDRLGLTHVCALRAAAKELGSRHRGAYSVVLARAVGKLRGLIPLAERYVSADGQFIAFKGPSYSEELEALGQPLPLALTGVREVALPLHHGTRYLLVFGRN